MAKEHRRGNREVRKAKKPKETTTAPEPLFKNTTLSSGTSKGSEKKSRYRNEYSQH